MRPIPDHSPKHDKLRDDCPVKAALDVIRGRWKPLILWELHNGTRRFAELRVAIPAVTAQTLTMQLRQLEADDIITRTVYPEVPVRVEYALSAHGQSLSSVMDELDKWGRSYLKRKQRRETKR